MVCNNIIVTYKNNKYNIIINKILTDINTIIYKRNYVLLYQPSYYLQVKNIIDSYIMKLK